MEKPLQPTERRTSATNSRQTSTGVSSVRLIVTVVIIVACFTALYPKFFHPILLRVLGLSQPPQQKADKLPTHPPHRPGMHSGHPSDPKEDDIRRHMRPGPHPGMRAAAEMNKQKQSSSGRGGVMGMILPVYAFGIIGYLIYTLVKVFGKKDKKEESSFYKGGSPKRRPQESTVRQTEAERLASQEDDLNGLQDLLNRASNVDTNISAEEMRELQKRLEETEKQMSQILNAMQHVSAKVSTVTSEAVKTDDEKKSEATNSGDSSPDISSYEVVDKSKEKKSSEVETVKASEDTQTETGDTQTEKSADDKDDENEETQETEEILKEKQEEEESGVRQRKATNVSSE